MAMKIKVHEKALGHLSRGLYRSPASALRELVSNAWDANATTVTINTNYPNFFQISIEDNGHGFSKQEFERMMSGGIGNSEKRARKQEPLYGRAVIGRLGIGMLGIAQICPSFVVISKPAKGVGFAASVRLYDTLKRDLDKQKGAKKDGPVMEVHVGEYDFIAHDLDSRPVGTWVYSTDVHPTFTKSFQESVKQSGFVAPSRSMADCVAQCSKVRSLNELGDYWKLVWELAASCPLPYIHEDALPSRLVKEDHKRLTSYNFAVSVDGIQLAKPVWLHGNADGYTPLRIKSATYEVYGYPVKFHGYLVVQEGKQIKPDELRGIMIRVKDVGIGYYDFSLLDYRINHGPRSRWLTGEIFVESGLEDALNIDRDSFNRFHPEFRAVQREVHRLLQDSVFPEVYKQIDVRSEKRAQAKAVHRAEHVSTVFKKAAKESLQLPAREVEKLAKSIVPQATDASTKPQSVFPVGIRLKASQRQLAESVLLAFDLAAEEKDPARRRDLFAELLAGVLAKW